MKLSEYATKELVEELKKREGVETIILPDSVKTIGNYAFEDVVLDTQSDYNPAGKLEKGEDPFEAGKRELKEETGAVANKYMSLGKLYPTPGYCGEIIHMYLATELEFGEQSPDEDEFLEVYKISLEDAVKMVMNGELPDSKTQTMILKINQLKDEGKI